jgi:hypothetical protein
MPAIELFLEKDGEYKPAGIWYCSECRIVKGDANGGKEEADKCCSPKFCADCKEDLGDRKSYSLICSPCRQKRNKAKEDEAFEKAEKVLPEEWDSWVWTDDTGHNDGYFESVEALIEWFNDAIEDGEEDAMPCYCWTTVEEKASYRHDWIIEHICENGWENQGDHIVDEDELEKFIDGWCAKQLPTFQYTYKKAVLLHDGEMVFHPWIELANG